MRGTKHECFDYVRQIKENCWILHRIEVRVITIKRGVIFHALAIGGAGASGREVLDRSASPKNALAAVEKLHDQTAAELADMFPDEVPDGVDIPAESPTTSEEGNNDTPPSSPEGVERGWASVTKHVVLKRCTEEPGVSPEACIPQFGKPVCSDGIPAQTTQDDTTTCPATAQLIEVCELQTPVMPEIPTEAAPVVAEEIEVPMAIKPQKKKGKKGKKGRGMVVNKMVQAIEDIAVGTPDITENPDPPPPPAPPSPPLPPLVQPYSPPRSPSSMPEEVAVPALPTPSPSPKPFGICQTPPATSDHYLASHAWHAYPKSPGDNDKTPPSLSSPIVGALDTLVRSIESLETPREKIEGILQVLGAVGRVLEGLVDGDGC
ncbi:MAG: hypothetical protein M1839_003600 [Geoglossum umbratile]|nr:MAG: hypothetical protein M1839_003600 [Geoglossum umbratile]